MVKRTCSVDGCENTTEKGGRGLCGPHHKRALRHDGDPLGGGIAHGAHWGHRGPYSGCWEWKGATNKAGYGWTNVKGFRTQLVHRIVYELIYGEVPPLLRHRCDNPPCYNPAHLLPGTHDDNMQDMLDRGRSARGQKKPNAILTKKDVEEILATPKVRGSGVYLAEKYGISQQLVCDIRKGRRWTWVDEDRPPMPDLRCA